VDEHSRSIAAPRNCKTSAVSAAETGRRRSDDRGSGGHQCRDARMVRGLAVDVYRPDKAWQIPRALCRRPCITRTFRAPDIADILPPQPAHAPLWFGPIRGGATRGAFIANGYVHCDRAAKGALPSRKGTTATRIRITTTLIEWITQQSWYQTVRSGWSGHLRLCRRTMARLPRRGHPAPEKPIFSL